MLHSAVAGASPEPDPLAAHPLGPQRAQRRGSAVAALALCVACAAAFRSAETPSLFWVLKPTAHCRAGVEGVEVVVHFREDARIDASSFRVLLNRAEVTEQLMQGSNGATGQLFGVLDGVNTLHIEIRSAADADAPSRLESRDLSCLVRGPRDFLRG